jgi:hypothetical protein
MLLNYERRVHLNTARRCTHIKITGHRCGSPALRGEYFCDFHTRMIKGLSCRVDMRIFPQSLIEDPESLQYSFMELIGQSLSRRKL